MILSTGRISCHYKNKVPLGYIYDINNNHLDIVSKYKHLNLIFHI